MDAASSFAALVSGGLIGLILGLVGGGRSILAVPRLIYVVGVASPHAAIGTAAVAVTVNALASLIGLARAGCVKWRCASVFAASGMVGAALGAELGKAFNGKRLLVLFGLLMIGVGLSMLRKRRTADAPDVRGNISNCASLVPGSTNCGSTSKIWPRGYFLTSDKGIWALRVWISSKSSTVGATAMSNGTHPTASAFQPAWPGPKKYNARPEPRSRLAVWRVLKKTGNKA